MVTDSIAPRPSAEMLGHIQHPSIPAVCVFVCVSLKCSGPPGEQLQQPRKCHIPRPHPWRVFRDAGFSPHVLFTSVNSQAWREKKHTQRTFLRLVLNGRTPTEDTDCKQQLFKVTETNRHHPPLRQNLLEHLLIICGAPAMWAVGSCCCCCLTATSYPPHCKQSSSLREAFRVSR